MWLSKRIVQETPEFEPATLGTVSIGGEDAAVVTDGEKRNARVISPGGYCWQPSASDSVLVIKGNELYVPGVLQSGGGVGEAMQAVLPADSVPVVEKKVVQQGAADQAFPVHPQAQAAAEPIAVIGDGEAVLQTGDTPVLGEGAHGLHLRTGQKSLGAGIEVQMLVSGEFHEAATSFLSYCMHL